ncbi:MAG: ChaN family lipoprotein [Thermoanaerobaculia bacterium]|nr:ChaN family lipoprotein [Thermoanaerobaculia bacterium]
MTPISRRVLPVLAALLLALAAPLWLGALAPLAPVDKILDLPIGDPARRDREAPVVLDGVTDTAKGEVITPAELAARLDGVELLFVGESHTDYEFHQVQLRTIEELQRRGRKVLIGLEMYPAGEQAMLDKWSTDPAYTEADFLAQSRWYKNWGYHWEYYRPIFDFAHRHGLRMFGLNVPRKVVQTARKEGLAALTPEQRELLPATIDTDSAEYRRLFQAFFSDDGLHGGMSAEMFEGMFTAQCTWDAAMAHNALKALARHSEGSEAGGTRAIMVVLIGEGHVAYGLGAERQARLTFQGRTASIIPVRIEDPKTHQPVTEARASFASFFWGVPPEQDPLYPVLGLSAPERDPGQPLTVIRVEEESVAAAAGFAAGDQLVAMDGTPIDQQETLNRLMSGKRWGDSARFEVLREGKATTLTAYFRRTPEKPAVPPVPPEPPAAPAPSAPPVPPAPVPPAGNAP